MWQVRLLINNASRVFFLLGVFILLLGGMSYWLGRPSFGLRLISYSFGFFVIGFIFYTLELKKRGQK